MVGFVYEEAMWPVRLVALLPFYLFSLCLIVSINVNNSMGGTDETSPMIMDTYVFCTDDAQLKRDSMLPISIMIPTHGVGESNIACRNKKETQ